MARSGASTHWVRTSASMADPVLGGTNNPFQHLFSMHCFVRSSVVPNLGSVRTIMGIVGDNTGSSENPYSIVTWDHTSSTFQKAAIERDGGTGTFHGAKLTSSPSADTWYSFGGSYDGTNVKVWLNGANEASTAANEGDNKKVWLSALADRLSSGTAEGQFSNGQVAECAWWNAALNADEFAALAKGFRPPRIRPAKLIAYWPLVRETLDLIGTALTDVNSPTVTDHPRVFG